MHSLTSICVRHPWKTVSLALAVTAVAVWFILRTDLVVGIDAHLGPDHPAVRSFDRFLHRFGGGYPVVIAFECNDSDLCDDVLDPPALEMADKVSREMQQSAFVSRVSSPANMRLLTSGGDLGIDARQLVVDGRVANDPELRRLALVDMLWKRTLISLDGRLGAIIVELSSTQSQVLTSVMDDIRRAIKPYPSHDFRFHLVGEAVMWEAVQEDALSSAFRVALGTGGLLFLTLVILIRSLRAVAASLATIGAAVIWTIGLLPLLGWHQSELTSAAAAVILVIGCADCVHFVAHHLESKKVSDEAVAALVATSRWVAAPCTLTTATSAASFVSFATGGVHSLVQFGLLSAIGVSLAFVLTFSLLPALMVLAPPKPRRLQYSDSWQEVLARLSDLGIRRKRVVLVLSLALALIGLAGIPKLRVELNPYELWSPDHPIQRSLAVVSQKLQRPDRVEIELTLPTRASIEDTGALETLSVVEEALSELDGLGEPRSIRTILLQADGLLRPSAAASRNLPQSSDAIGELLTMISASDPAALDSWLTIDHNHVRVSVETEDLSLSDRSKLIREINESLRAHLPAGWSALVTGPSALLSFYGAEFARSQLSIISVSSLAVFALIAIYLRSLSWAFLAVIPNAVALILLFGAMGHWGIKQDAGSAVVAPIAIGIAADDTIHFLTAYARRRNSGVAPIKAVRCGISSVGEAVIATAIALALGFLSMMTSPMASVANIGLLSAIAIVGATLADLLVLPALIATVAEWTSFKGLAGRYE